MDNFNNTNYEYDPSGQGYYSEGYNEGYYQGGGGPHIYPEGGEAYYDAGGGGTGYPPSYNGVDAATSYYPQQQYDYSQGSWDQGQGSHDWNNSQSATNSTKKGNFYFHTEFTPQISGFPVSSLAYDAAYEAMYVASTTQSVSSTRWKSHRASMLVTHSTLDGMLYSSVAGHPEASSSALQTVYGCMFGIPKTVLMPPGRQHIPPHAYKAPFGGSNVEFGREQGQIGITEILPLNGYAASVSPSAVRIHAHGGLQLHDHDIEGMICGTIHPRSDQGAATHISVGGISCGSQYKDHEIYCMDLWQGLRTVSTRNIRDAHDKKVGITTLVTSHDRGSIIAGCSDGNIRLLDGALRELATVKTHSSGVSSMAVSADGMLIATTGYGSAGKVKDTSVLYAFPDPTVYVYDIRYLGRGGISHPFAGVRGSPHHLIFVQDIDGLPSNRLMIGSGQPGGGLQVIVPFQAQDQGTTSFYTPPWEQGESISAMSQSDDEIALGTSLGRVLRYRLKGYQLTKIKSPTLNSGFVPSKSPNKGSSLTSSNKRSRKKQPLEMPPFVPPMPAVSVDPNLLLNGNDHGMRNGADEKIKSLFGTYILHVDPKLSSIGNTVEDAPTTFGSLASTPAFPGKRRTVAPNFLNEATPGEVEYLLTVPTSKLDLDLLASHNVVSKRYRGKLKDPQPNPNKFLYCSKLSSVCYEDGLNGKRRNRGTRSNSVGSGDLSDEVPPRYRLQKRPNFKSSGAFDPSDYNDTGLFPGWDYVPTMPNAFASPVLLLLYFHPEIRSAVLAAQYSDGLWSAKGYEKALSPELGFVFNQIESLSRFGLVHPVKANSDPLRRRIGAWIPSNFLTALSTMPEAEQLQILDGSPAAVDPQRRPEAFYRFLAYQLDKELSKNSDTKIMDSLHGIDFMSINQFITGSSPPSQSRTRSLTVDLSYDMFSRGAVKKPIRFGELLQYSLCRDTRLRAWNQSSKAYETIVQRKIATSLPRILTLSATCAGRKEEEGLWVWRTDDGGDPWLPEMIEVDLEPNGSVIVREMVKPGGDGGERWATFKGKSSLPPAVSKLVSDASSREKYRYRLESVLSFVNDEAEGIDDEEHPGHHVLHARTPREYKRRVLKYQQEEAEKRAKEEIDPTKLVLTADVKPEIFQKRSEYAGKMLSAVDEEETGWIMYNGFAVSSTIVEDARAFHVSFKEPCLVVFRAIDSGEKVKPDESDEQSNQYSPRIPQVLNARSLSNKTARSNSRVPDKIEKGDRIAFDAEFVCVQEEEATLAEDGSKMVLRETRHALGRISLLDCKTRGVILDDHVLPTERVVDYLTRFSGIVAEDLDRSKTTHNLISTRNAYLKLRYFMERGCIFVGHGLRQDFAMVNLIVPPDQIIDTVEIFHQPGMRYISLRFLANCVLGRDMQQDIHDSVEDALASFELYEKALQWKAQGIFGKKLQEIYTHGTKNDWKLGLDEA